MATRKRNKRLLGYSVGIEHGAACNYRHFRIHIFQGVERDAADGYDHDPSQHNLERMQRIRELGESTRYMSCDRTSFVLSWQTDREIWNCDATDFKWYLCSVQDLRLESEPVLLLAKLVKLGMNIDSNPDEILGWLQDNGAVHVSHDSAPYCAFILRPEHYNAEQLNVNPFEVAHQD